MKPRAGAAGILPGREADVGGGRGQPGGSRPWEEGRRGRGVPGRGLGVSHAAAACALRDPKSQGFSSQLVQGKLSERRSDRSASGCQGEKAKSPAEKYLVESLRIFPYF